MEIGDDFEGHRREFWFFRLWRGQFLGRCGNSGNSPEPHLHYQLQDSPIFQEALGIKVWFQQLVLTTNGKSETKTHYSPVKGDILSPGE